MQLGLGVMIPAVGQGSFDGFEMLHCDDVMRAAHGLLGLSMSRMRSKLASVNLQHTSTSRVVREEP